MMRCGVWRSLASILRPLSISLSSIPATSRWLAKFSRLDAGEFVGVSSVITLVEVLTQPKKADAVVIEREYNALLLNSQHLSIDLVTHAIAERAADLRARY